MGKTIIVTGGCGYIGSHVARAFKYDNESNRVVIIDREYRPHTLKNIDGFQRADFASDPALSFMLMEEPDVIVHCAGTSLVGPSMLNPGEYYDNNISKTIKMLNVVKNMSKKPLIMFSSSASVYGVPKFFPVDEDSAVQPISPYGNTKAMTEIILKDYARAHKIDSVVFRYFNAAGAMPITHDLGQEPNATHIVARILEAAISNSDFTMYGSDYDTPDGSCIRDYVHVWDIALAHVRASHYFDKPGLGQSTVYNLGTAKGTSNFDIVKYVTEKYGLKGLMVQGRREGDPDRLVASYERAKMDLGWTPVNSDIRNIIDSAYKWYTRNTETVDSTV